MDADITLHSGPTGPVELISYSYDRDGITLGAGLETLIPGTKWSAKIEYRNTTWSEEKTILLGPDLGITFWDDAMVQTIRGVLSYRIGSENAPVSAASTSDSAANIDWTGLHVGAGLGYGGVRTTAGLELFDYDPGGLLQIGPFDLYSIGAELDRGGDGWVGSVEAGYDVQLGNFVVGIVGDYTGSGIETQGSIFGAVCYEYPITGTSGADDDCSTNTISDRPDITYTLKTGESWSVLGRAGLLVNPETLVYGIAGYTHTTMDADFTLHSGPTGPVELVSYSYDRDGITLGAGIETMIDQNWSAKFEYRNTTWSDEQTFGGPVEGLKMWDDAMVQTARAVVSYRF